MKILGQEEITLRRFAAGTRGSDGRWVDGAETETPILAGVQEGDGDAQATLPEGERTKSTRVVYSGSVLRPVSQADQTPADRLLIDGEWWEVRNVARVRSIMPHYKAVATKFQEPAG